MSCAVGALPHRTVVIGARRRDPRCVNFLRTRISVAMAAIPPVHANHSEFPDGSADTNDAPMGSALSRGSPHPVTVPATG